jgi:3-oxoacyl-[acyl-carrier-protein] synthase-1
MLAAVAAAMPVQFVVLSPHAFTAAPPGALAILASSLADHGPRSRSHCVPPASPSQPLPPLAIRAYTATTALGAGRGAQLDALRARRSGLRHNDFAATTALDTWIGRVDGVEEAPLPSHLARWECRNNRLAWLALQQDGVLEAVVRLRHRLGANRIAIVLGTSTSSIGATEEG